MHLTYFKTAQKCINVIKSSIRNRTTNKSIDYNLFTKNKKGGQLSLLASSNLWI